MKRQRFSDHVELCTSHDHHVNSHIPDNHGSVSRGGGKRKGTGDWSNEEIRRLIICIINNRSILFSKSANSPNDLSAEKISKEVSIRLFTYE